MTERTTKKINHGTNAGYNHLYSRPVNGTHHNPSDGVLDLNSEFESEKYNKDYVERPHTTHSNHSHSNKKRAKKKSKAPLIIIIAAAVIILGIYFAVALYGQNHFLPNTYIRGQEVSWLSAEDAEAKLITGDTSFVIKKIDGEEIIEFSDINYVIELTNPAEDIIAGQNVWIWPLRIFTPSVYSNGTSISYDKTALSEKIYALEMFKSENIIKCKNAYIGLDSDGHYVIISEITGNELKKSDTISAIKNAIANGLYEIDLVKEGLYKKPSVFSDDKDLNKTLSDFKVLNEEIITIDLEGGKTITLAPADLVKFVNISGNDFSVDEDYLAQYMDKLDEKYSTYMKARNFKTHSGKAIKVGGSVLGGVDGDTYGYKMDKETSTNILRNAIYSCQSQTISLVWDMVGNVRDDYNGDIGDTYIEISISEQHMWYYKDGVVALETDVVTGLGSYEKRQTPEGIYCAVYKDTNVKLTGAMDGSQWKTTVDYWIGVTWTGVGIHDSSWQPCYGGDWYWWNGSHGCINTPPSVMATLYGMVEMYTPIVIYSFSDEHVTSDGVHATRNNYQNEEYVEETTTPATTTAPATTEKPADQDDPVVPVDPDPVDPVDPDPVDPVEPDPVDPVDPDPEPEPNPGA